MKIIHHGGAKGVTGSCHELVIDHEHSVLIDCGLFQGNDVSQTRTETEQLKVDFPIETIEALIVTHCHIDHVGRLPYLLMAGFDKKILCSVATAQLADGPFDIYRMWMGFCMPIYAKKRSDFRRQMGSKKLLDNVTWLPDKSN
jgi:glyoxylase-like metal-dependent hydrolase (beta-lactamase superfamily II)